MCERNELIMMITLAEMEEDVFHLVLFSFAKSRKVIILGGGVDAKRDISQKKKGLDRLTLNTILSFSSMTLFCFTFTRFIFFYSFFFGS